jgi:uncharacterized FAD-dependent dehydrogenase
LPSAFASNIRNRMIDRARLGKYAGHPELGAADYKLVTYQASNGRAVYSFCMCPGGTVVAATSEPGRVVTNGMSQYSRNERNANAGIVVGINPEQDFPGGPMAGIEFQERLESVLLSWAAAITVRRRNWLAISSGRPPRVWVRWSRPTSPAYVWAISASALPDYAIKPSARRCRPSASRFAASTALTRC